MIGSIIDNLATGFSVSLTLMNLLFCLSGVLIGTLIGVLPGIGPVPAIAMLLPITFRLDPISSLIMLAGIYYGAQYGGSTTSILVNIPGESASVVTCLDGYQMARQGRAGPALAIAALGSFFAGCVGTSIIALSAPPLARFALQFGPAEFFSLFVMGLVAAAALTHGSLLKGLAMICLGVLMGMVGTDISTGVARFTFGILDLSDGISFVVLAVGLFGLAEIIANLELKGTQEIFTSKVRGLMPTWADIKASFMPVVRGSFLGSFLGILPGGGAALSSFASYAMEKRVAKDPSRFGKGAIEGVAGPESANNAGAQTAFIPMLTLGIPSNPVMALLLGAMLIQGVNPGPQVITKRPDLFWGIVTSMWIGNLMLVVLNLPLIGIWVRLLTVPYRFLYPAILVFCAIGVFSVNNSTFDIIILSVFGLVGYIFKKLDCEPAPLMLGFILGMMMDESFRRAMLLSRGDPTVFFTRPISLTLMLLAAFVLLTAIIPTFRRKREEAFRE